METFKSFLAEQEQPYKLLILSHDDPQDPNETGPLVRKKAKELGIEVYLAELMGSYIENDGKDKLLYSYPVDEKGQSQLPDTKSDIKYDKPFRMNPENTLVMMRGLNAKSGCKSWFTMARTLEADGYTVVNSALCNEICNDKWYNQIVFQQNNIQINEKEALAVLSGKKPKLTIYNTYSISSSTGQSGVADPTYKNYSNSEDNAVGMKFS